MDWKFLFLGLIIGIGFHSLNETIKAGFLDIINKLEEMHPTYDPTDNEDDWNV